MCCSRNVLRLTQLFLEYMISEQHWDTLLFCITSLTSTCITVDMIQQHYIQQWFFWHIYITVLATCQSNLNPLYCSFIFFGQLLWWHAIVNVCAFNKSICLLNKCKCKCRLYLCTQDLAEQLQDCTEKAACESVFNRCLAKSTPKNPSALTLSKRRM